MDIVTQYLLSLVPAVTALAGMVTIIGVSIGKIKKANRETVDKVTESDRTLKKQLVTVQKENIELKKALTKIEAKLNHVHFVETKEE